MVFFKKWIKYESTYFNNNIENYNDFKSFKYQTKLLGNIVAQPDPNQANAILKNDTITVPSKYLSKYLRYHSKCHRQISKWN